MKNKIVIRNRKIGSAYKPFVIAEIGINHEGSMEKAIKMVDAAYKAGCECVKFQAHIIEDEMIPNKVIPGNAKETIWNIIDRCKLTEEEDIKIKKYVESKGMIYLSTPFSRAAADRLHRMNVDAYKIGSGECNNYPLIDHIAKFGKPIILSTGMNDIPAIKKAVDIIKKHKTPFAILHCTSMYPTPYNKVRLGAFNDIRENFPHTVFGLSDHSLGNYTSFASIVFGAAIIEKHFTSSKRWKGPDIPISIDQKELKDLIIGCNAIHQALGGSKTILKEEKPTINFAYACVVSIKNINKGELFTNDNIWVKRPGTGEIKAVDYEKVLGKKANSNIKIDTQIKWDDIKK
jgi:N-acetylneuraminate synthase